MRSSALLLLALVACTSSSGGERKPGPAAQPATEAVPPSNAARAEPAVSGKPLDSKPPSETELARQAVGKLAREDEAQRLLEGWVAAQNAGDYERYGALYAERFLGVKRIGAKEQRFTEREAWLLDRKRMFKQRMQVELAAVRIRANDKGVAIRFVQHFSSGRFQDVGPKQLILLAQPDGALRIAKEEMLGSTVIGQKASHDPKQFAFLTRLRGRVAIEVEPPAQPYTLESLLSEGAIKGEEDASELDISGIIVATADSPQLAAWRGARVRLFGVKGVECVASVEHLLIALRYTDHTFSGWSDYWLDDDGNPRKLSEPEMLERLRGEGAFFAATLDVDPESECAKETSFARAADLPPSVVLGPVEGTPELTKAVLDVVEKTKSYARNAETAESEDYTDNLRDEVGVSFYGLPGQAPRFAWAAARLGCPCWSCDVSLDVFCKIAVAGDSITVSVDSEPDWDDDSISSIIDANATGDFQPVVASDFGYVCFSGVCTREISGPSPDDSQPKPP